MWAVSSSRADICTRVHISPVLILTGGERRGQDRKRKSEGRKAESGHSHTVEAENGKSKSYQCPYKKCHTPFLLSQCSGPHYSEDVTSFLHHRGQLYLQ